jgi:predicted NAD/FAD-dependent oxidoreductase
MSVFKGRSTSGKSAVLHSKPQFSVQHGGRSDILQHIKKRKHAIAAETKSCSEKKRLILPKKL